MFGKQTAYAITALCRLAVLHGRGDERVAAGDLARACGLQPPTIAKVMSTLAQSRLVTAMPGPGGGYALARPADRIYLAEVQRALQPIDEPNMCPFLGRLCCDDKPCPLHERMASIRDNLTEMLETTTLDVFLSGSFDWPIHD